MPDISTTFLKGGKKVDFDVTPLMSTYCWRGLLENLTTCKDSPKGRPYANIRTSRSGKPVPLRPRLRYSLLDYYNEFFKIPYPLPKCDMICITALLPELAGNYGLITYREVAPMVDDEVASAATKQRVAIVIAHELAHQWFGNLVTMEWWNGLWLNEGFAAFCEHFGTDAIYPEYNIWEQYTTGAFRHAQALIQCALHPLSSP